MAFVVPLSCMTQMTLTPTFMMWMTVRLLSSVSGSRVPFRTESTVITLSDWYHYLSPDAPAVADPSATLINGLGRYDGGDEVDLAVITVESGKRLVSSAVSYR